MASIEFITKRIEGKKAELAKLNKKMERIEKAAATNWEVNPYYYSENDMKWTAKDIENAKAALAKLESELETANDKAASRNVPAITEFLDNWYNRVLNMYVESVPQYIEARNDWFAFDKKYCEWRNYESHNCTKEERKAKEDERKEYYKKFSAEWSWLTPYMERTTLDMKKLERDLKNEYNRKYDFIIERTNEIVKVITDASGLKVGAKGDLNGYIIGTNGTAKVQTIGAGGYNIQCYHFRTLIHSV